MNLNQLYLKLLCTGTATRLQRLVSPQAGGELDLAFVTPPASAPAWILDGICREVAARLTGVRTAIHSIGTPLPIASRYFFSHFMFFIDSLRGLSPVHNAESYVFATHLEAEKYGVPDALVAKLLARATLVFCMNQRLLETLARLGVPRNRLTTLVGACSAGTFKPHQRDIDGKVGFCSAYYERKSPGTVLDIVRAMPHRRFLLLGRGWRNYSRFPELAGLQNFEYVEPSYAEYPGYYAQMSAFVSVSLKEGGPVPLLEAMMSNVVPVASRTGFAPDVIEHGRNGYLFDVGASPSEICELIDRAFTLMTDVRATVVQCDWEPYAAQVARDMRLPAAVNPPSAATS
jgi:glycosyltransferase involved in cell wall biosynthesis